MGVFKSCLAVIGLIALLFVGSCVAGIATLGSLMDPQAASGTVNRSPNDVKQEVYSYLQGAANGSFGSKAHVDYMSDGSMRLLVGKQEPYDMKMAATFAPENGGAATKVDVTYNADRLAWGQPDHVRSTSLDRHIHADVLKLIADLNKGESGGTLDLDGLVDAARKSEGGSDTDRRR